MALTLSPRIQARIAELVEHSDYPDADAVVAQALTLFEEHERLVHLRKLVALGAEQARRGEPIEYNDRFREEAIQSALRRFAEGDVPSPDVCP
jgi:Arc/MetJ-type ribon-helix-helix transcriptional regulator